MSLTKIETNVIAKPSIQTVMKIAKDLGISIDYSMK
jgi:transcriptional regulator with XRE-family HTH domain